jgi:hypothetical protein
MSFLLDLQIVKGMKKGQTFPKQLTVYIPFPGAHIRMPFVSALYSLQQ